MKKIEAIIRPSKLEELKEALAKIDVDGITIEQVQGCGKQHGWTEYYRGSEVLINTLPKIRFSMVVDDSRQEEIIGLICRIARTGEVGDGKIFVSEISDCVRIRTGERGVSAL